MCKIMVMSGVNSSNRTLAWEFSKRMSKQMTTGNNDGLGYAAVTSEGELFGERWHINSEAFLNRTLVDKPSEIEQETVKKYGGFLVSERPPAKYNKFGTINEDSMSAIILHTRLATSGKQFNNTHPFVRGNTALIHNGVISNTREFKLIQSTCDSEVILNEYVEKSVTNNPQNIQKVVNKLDGYYACAVLTETKKFGFVVDIFKDARARLVAAHIKDMNIMVFSTSLEDIKIVSESMGMTIDFSYSVNEGVLLRLSTLTGDPLLTQKFKPEFKRRKSESLTELSSDDAWEYGYRRHKEIDYLKFKKGE